jgi:heptosyltransferase-2
MNFLIIQTAFIGDVILATPIVEKLRRFYPDARIDMLVRKGNESLLAGHPHLHRVWVWDKNRGKYRRMLQLIARLRQQRYDCIVNCQRFAASGIITLASGARQTVGFDKNPCAPWFTKKVPHIVDGRHEVVRNLQLIEHLTDAPSPERPRLYPSEQDRASAKALTQSSDNYICIAPTSVWFTKQLPAHKWVGLIQTIPQDTPIYLLGAPGDREACADIQQQSGHPGVHNAAGALPLLASAALMEGARMNYVNDSAPMHLASAVNAPVRAVFCSTSPSFGFSPLSDQSSIIEAKNPLSCRPCGLHGHNACPKKHFHCAENIDIKHFI